MNSYGIDLSFFVCLFVGFDSLCPSQQSFSYVGMGLPGFNQYLARINVSCSKTQGSDAGEARKNCFVTTQVCGDCNMNVKTAHRPPDKSG